MPRRAKVRPDEPGRDKILEAGLELFADRGYEVTSIADIGRRAGIAKSVLYHYFESKAALYAAIAETETERLLDRVAAAVPDDTRTHRLRRGLDAYLGFLAERPAAWRLLVRDPPAEPELVELHRRLEERRTAVLAELLASPRKRAESGLHVELVATAIRAFSSWWYDHRDVPREEVTRAILDVARAGAKRIRPYG